MQPIRSLIPRMYESRALPDGYRRGKVSNPSLTRMRRSQWLHCGDAGAPREDLRKIPSASMNEPFACSPRPVSRVRFKDASGTFGKEPPCRGHLQGFPGFVKVTPKYMHKFGGFACGLASVRQSRRSFASEGRACQRNRLRTATAARSRRRCRVPDRIHPATRQVESACLSNPEDTVGGRLNHGLPAHDFRPESGRFRH